MGAHKDSIAVSPGSSLSFYFAEAGSCVPIPLLLLDHVPVALQSMTPCLQIPLSW